MTALRDYRNIELKRLTEVNPEVVIELMNDAEVRRHMPLARGHFGIAEYKRFMAAKERIWDENGYGPWAFVLEGDFVGWGGLQPEGNDVDVGLVLRQVHWGAGRVIYQMILDYAFGELGLQSLITLLPPSRTRIAGLRRLGFRQDGRVMIDDQPFNRYRLTRC